MLRRLRTIAVQCRAIAGPISRLESHVGGSRVGVHLCHFGRIGTDHEEMQHHLPRGISVAERQEEGRHRYRPAFG